MKTRLLIVSVLAASLLIGARPSAAGSETDLYARMQHVNSNLASYQADVTVAIVTHGFPFISPTLTGEAYYKRPDRTAVHFKTVPALASQLKTVVGQIEPPYEWDTLYLVTPGADDGTQSQFRLVRKKNGRIDHVDVVVDDKTATVSSMTYVYKDDGGTISFRQDYDRIGDDYVIKSQSGKVDIPHYNADVSSTFSNYKLNVAIDDKVFHE